MSLIAHLQTVRDYRTQPDYPLWVILVLIIMGMRASPHFVRSGATGYRSLTDFVSRHQAALLEIMELPYARLPGFSTLRRVMVRVDAPVNFGIVRTFCLNLFRLNGFDSITRGLRFLAHDVQKLFSFFQ